MRTSPPAVRLAYQILPSSRTLLITKMNYSKLSLRSIELDMTSDPRGSNIANKQKPRSKEAGINGDLLLIFETSLDVISGPSTMSMEHWNTCQVGAERTPHLPESQTMDNQPGTDLPSTPYSFGDG
jgi:hypothetical protein